MAKLAPVSPGEILSVEFLEPMGITKYRLAKEIGVPAQRIGNIVAGKARNHCGHRSSPLSVFRTIERLLAASAGGLGHRACRRGAGQDPRFNADLEGSREELSPGH